MKKNGEKYPWIKSIFKKKRKPNGPEGVYAGPEFFGKDEVSKPVYAGPGYFKNETRKVYEGPDPRTKNGGSESSAPTGDVYAGPEYFSPQDRATVMCVYAGPEYFNPQNGTPAGSTRQPQPESKPEIPEGDGVRCPACGNVLIPGSGFCHECGMPVKTAKEDE